MKEYEKLEAIWYIVSQIPRGKVSTYGEVAKLAGFPGHARYTGYALKKLEHGSKVPWHRVINSQGKISFPVNSEHYLCQSSRLKLEGINIKNGRIRLKDYLWNP